MNVIGHDHIATNGDVEAGFGTFGKKGECRMNVVASKKSLSLVSAKSDEIQGLALKARPKRGGRRLKLAFTRNV